MVAGDGPSRPGPGGPYEYRGSKYAGASMLTATVTLLSLSGSGPTRRNLSHFRVRGFRLSSESSAQVAVWFPAGLGLARPGTRRLLAEPQPVAGDMERWRVQVAWLPVGRGRSVSGEGVDTVPTYPATAGYGDKRPLAAGTERDELEPDDA